MDLALPEFGLDISCVMVTDVFRCGLLWGPQLPAVFEVILYLISCLSSEGHLYTT